MLLHAEGVISGTVFFDANGDDVRGVDEAGAPGIVLQLTSTDSSVSRSVITDNNGNYTFDELEPGNYQVVKRQMRATSNDSGNATAVNVSLADDQVINRRFSEDAVRPEFINIGWFFASAPPDAELVRQAIARGEELDGDQELADLIRAGGNDVPINLNDPPVAGNDAFEVEENTILAINASTGVLANDLDNDGDSLTARLVAQATHGVVELRGDGSFNYTPDTDFSGIDSFTYRASDGIVESNVATATITVNDASGQNQIPSAVNDRYETQENESLIVDVESGVLANDTDADSDSLTANIVDQPSQGTVTLNPDGSFSYRANTEFFGDDSFTYLANDGQASSNVATVSITIRPVDDGSPFAAVTTGSFTDANLLGARTDQVAGAPPITANHVDGNVDYSNHSNPPTYGDHHGFDPQGTDSNPGITPRPTGIYTAEQPEEDLIHNLEHGHVWISYNPDLLSAADVDALEQLVRDGVGNAQGSGAGVILTPRAANQQAIALASWARLLTLDRFDPETIRDFVDTNRGKAPEGFITP